MATINIFDLRPAGYDLLSDKESFIDNLSEEELTANKGGTSLPTLIFTFSSPVFIYTRK
ncbi:MAG: hypothetical protein RMX65_030310 [Nostoc sp. DedQUE01]